MNVGVSGAVIGVPGGSLGQATQFGDAGQIGMSGETRSGRLLAALASRPGGPTVIHDVRIPIPGFSANIDHIVISGRDLTLLDTKVWRDGFYWTLGGKTRRGMEAVPHLDKKTLLTGVDAIRRALIIRGLRNCTFRRSVLLVWPSKDGATGPNLTFYRSPGVVPVIVKNEQAALNKIARLTGSRSADPQVVSAVSSILY